MSAASSSIGWHDHAYDDPQIEAQRAYLLANNGISKLELASPSNLERALELFHRDGFVVIENVIAGEQVEELREGCNRVVDEIIALDTGRGGNRGSHRYSFGGSSLTRSQLHQPAWQMMLSVPFVDQIVSAIFGSPNYCLRAASGDFCLPGAVDYQRLHSDVHDFVSLTDSPFSSFRDPTGAITMRDLPTPYVCVNFLPQEVTRINGPTRQIPGTQKSRAKIPGLKSEPEWMRLSTVCPAPAGAIMVRDVRAWHGGTPNLSEATRSIPNLEFYAPWFREPIVPGIAYADWKKLPERAQEIARFCVADSSEELITGATLRAP